MEHQPVVSAFDDQMWRIRARRYANLNWVNNSGPLGHFMEIAGLKGDETVVDVGTGSQAVAKEMSRYLNTSGKVLAFDISRDMLELGNDPIDNIHPFVGDATKMPLEDSMADLVVARMVYHHLPDPVEAVKEASRVLIPSGKLFVAEHVVLDEEVKAFERVLFEAKEPGRHLWTVTEMENLMEQAGLTEIESFPGMIEQYNMTEWMINSGLGESTQKKVLSYFKKVPNSVRSKLRINFDGNDNIFMDGYYACVVGKKSL